MLSLLTRWTFNSFNMCFTLSTANHDFLLSHYTFYANIITLQFSLTFITNVFRDKLLSNTSFDVFFVVSFVPICSLMYLKIPSMLSYISAVVALQKSLTFTLLFVYSFNCRISRERNSFFKTFVCVFITGCIIDRCRLCHIIFLIWRFLSFYILFYSHDLLVEFRLIALVLTEM